MASKRKAAKKSSKRPPLVGVIMGSTSDWETMRHAAETLEALGVPYEKRVVSAHRTPRLMFEYATRAAGRGPAGPYRRGGRRRPPARDDGGARARCPSLACRSRPPPSRAWIPLCSIVQMPGGIPVATFAIGKPGAINAGLFAASILALGDPALARALADRRSAQTRKVLAARLP